MDRYSAAIIGSGLGGLSCGALLAKEGMKVCIIEQHNIVGGCLQSFVRKGQVFDTGIHYIGSMDEGQVMRQFMKYYGVLDKIKLLPVDKEAYETVVIAGKEYKLPSGSERFVEELGNEFPEDKDGLKRLIDLVMEVKNAISVEVLRQGQISIVDMQKYMSMTAQDVINEHITNSTLRGILASCSLLFGGEKETACFYHYAMVMGSNIEGSYRILGGTQSLANALADVIRENGGEIITNDAVTRIAIEGDTVSRIETKSGRKIEADNFISSVHPKQTFSLTDHTPLIKKAFINRMNDLRNSYGLFTVYMTLKEKRVPFRNTFYLIHTTENTWFDQDNDTEDYDQVSMLLSYKPSEDMEWASTASIIAPMSWKDYEKWNETSVGKRGSDYEEWKQKIANTFIERADKMYPGLAESVENVYTASPLTFRDYTLTPNGSAYGILKNGKNPLPTVMPTQTKIKNLHLTGQSIFVPGAIGVTMTAAITCAVILGEEYLAKKIANA